jgi:hypothetical protein
MCNTYPFSHCNNGCTNVPQCYVIRTFPVLLRYWYNTFQILIQRSIVQTRIRIACRMETGQPFPKSTIIQSNVLRQFSASHWLTFGVINLQRSFSHVFVGSLKHCASHVGGKKRLSGKKRDVVLPCLLLLISRAACKERVQHTRFELRTFSSPYGLLGSLVRAYVWKGPII